MTLKNLARQNSLNFYMDEQGNLTSNERPNRVGVNSSPILNSSSSNFNSINLIKNGSFETGMYSSFPLVALNPTSGAITGWTVIRGQIDYNLGYWVSANGKRSIDLNGSPGVGGIAQTFTTAPGQRYRVSFALAGNPDAGLPIKKMAVAAAGQSANFSFDTTGRSISNMGWENKTWTFTANSTTTNLQFYSLSDDPADASYGATLDNVSVVALPPDITLVLNWAGISENSPDRFVYTFTRNGASLTDPLTVNFAVGGTATLGSNYTVAGGATSFSPTDGTITFAPGSATAQLSIAPKDDNLFTPNKWLSITITPGSSYNVGTKTGGIATIINNDGTRSPVPTSSNDIITGSNRFEVIYGGLGRDVLIGGTGTDAFDYQNPNEGGDSIRDFNTYEDLIFVRGSSFDSSLIGGTLSPDRFVKGIGATSGNQRFIYNDATGALLFDRDGNGATAPITLATLSKGLAFTHENIFVS